MKHQVHSKRPKQRRLVDMARSQRNRWGTCMVGDVRAPLAEWLKWVAFIRSREHRKGEVAEAIACRFYTRLIKNTGYYDNSNY